MATWSACGFQIRSEARSEVKRSEKQSEAKSERPAATRLTNPVSSAWADLGVPPPLYGGWKPYQRTLRTF